MKRPRWAAGRQAGGRYTCSIPERLTPGAASSSHVQNSPQKPPKPPRLLSYSSGTAKKSRGYAKPETSQFPPETSTPTRLYSPTRTLTTQKAAPSGQKYAGAALSGLRNSAGGFRGCLVSTRPAQAVQA